uniref:coiled-coil domain-containing protein 68 n=1 Tax=Euleptes europaea TaxID=460621 RepID=UPI002541B6FB|nr:coiled-coil domain-containing protein 68 [Euleptes europaea]
MAFIGQSTPNIRKKLQRLKAPSAQPLEVLMHTAYEAYTQQEVAGEKKEEKKMKRQATLLAAALQGDLGDLPPPPRGRGRGWGRREAGQTLGRNQCALCGQQGHWRRDCPQNEPVTGHPKALITMTTLVLTQHVLRDYRGTEGNYLLYGSNASEIAEETEYIKQIRSTLAKVQPLLCRERGVPNGTLGSKTQFQESGLDPDQETLASSYMETVEKVEETEQELSRVNKENEWLLIKLEASRAAGIESVKNATHIIQDEYNRRYGDFKKRREGVIHTMKARKSEQEATLKQSTDNLSRMNVALQEKYNQIEELEKRVQRMGEEKKTLKEKQRLLKGKLQQMMSKAEDTNSCIKVQTEISTLQEQISHLDHVIHSQHQNLHALIHQIEDLNNELRIQDERIESLKEKIGMLQAKNEELKDKVQFWSGQSKSRVSKAVSVKLDVASPYTMITRLRK